MTYEEAKIQIQAIPEKIWDQLSEPDREAMEMAFSALQAQDSPKPTAESVQNVKDDDLVSRKAAIDAVEHIASSMSICVNTDECHGMKRMQRQAVIELANLPSAQPERTCVNCGRTANNGGWYADGKTRCPIEEHYALPKDGYCHLWEKRNVTDDDYPERQKNEQV